MGTKSKSDNSGNLSPQAVPAWPKEESRKTVDKTIGKGNFASDKFTGGPNTAKNSAILHKMKEKSKAES